MKNANEPIDIYRNVKTKKLIKKEKPRKSKIAFLLILILAVILAVLVWLKITTILKNANLAKEYQNQLVTMKQLEEQKNMI